MTGLYAEDLSVGDAFDYGSHMVTESEIIEFAKAFDLQPFHVDPLGRGRLDVRRFRGQRLARRRADQPPAHRRPLRRAGAPGRPRPGQRPVREPAPPDDPLSGIIRVVSLEDPDDRRGSREVVFDAETRIDDERVFSIRIFSISHSESTTRSPCARRRYPGSPAGPTTYVEIRPSVSSTDPRNGSVSPSGPTTSARNDPWSS